MCLFFRLVIPEELFIDQAENVTKQLIHTKKRHSNENAKSSSDCSKFVWECCFNIFCKNCCISRSKVYTILIQNHHLFFINVLVGVEPANFFVCQYLWILFSGCSACSLHSNHVAPHSCELLCLNKYYLITAMFSSLFLVVSVTVAFGQVWIANWLFQKTP
jgi:hypothetical protein